jgi:hypothetical protein
VSTPNGVATIFCFLQKKFYRRSILMPALAIVVIFTLKLPAPTVKPGVRHYRCIGLAASVRCSISANKKQSAL